MTRGLLGIDPVEWARSLGDCVTVTYWRLDVDYAKCRLTIVECDIHAWTPWESYPDGWWEGRESTACHKIWVYPESLETIVEESLKAMKTKASHRRSFQLCFDEGTS